MASDIGLIVVKAIYDFKGTNNDELNFKKGDLITITQMTDGGWWEGTLRDVTGWFPSNYVKENRHDSGGEKSPQGNRLTLDVLNSRQENLKVYRNVVLKDMIDSERAHIAELQTLQKTFLHPLQASEILPPDEYILLIGNLDEVVAAHLKLLKALEDCNDIPPSQQRIGGTFIQLASHLKSVHLGYCSGHPKAADVMERYKNELSNFIESLGGAVPGYRFLTAGLSKPFRRLEKYRGLLLEIEHQIEESHVDRGDTQRAAHVYKDIAETCANMRRQKEIELEVLQGNIRGWEGEDVKSLGDILLMAAAVLITEAQERRDRYLVLFPHTLVFLSVSHRMSAFVYEGKLPLAGINVCALDDSDGQQHAFEITGNMIDRIVVVCPSCEEQAKWLELIKQQIRVSRTPVVGSTKPPTLSAQFAPPSPLVTSLETKSQSPLSKTPYKLPNQLWSNTCLRPAPPIRPCLAFGSKEEAAGSRRFNSRLQKKKEEKSFEDDARILRVIEAYCNSAKSRYTVNSTLLDSPQVLIAEEEKIINEVTYGKQTIVEEKSLVDTVYALKDQIRDLQLETRALAKTFEEEQKSIKKLKDVVKKYVVGVEDGVTWDD